MTLVEFPAIANGRPIGAGTPAHKFRQGCVIILPLKPEKIEKLLREEERTVDLEPDEIEVFQPGVPLHRYGGAIEVTIGLSLAEKRAYGVRLVSGLIDVLVEMGRKGIVIETVTARSTKPDGIRLLRDLGFTQMPSTTEKKDLIFDVKKSGAREVMQYKQALIESGMVDKMLLEQFTSPPIFSSMP